MILGFIFLIMDFGLLMYLNGVIGAIHAETLFGYTIVYWNNLQKALSALSALSIFSWIMGIVSGIWLGASIYLITYREKEITKG